MQLGRFSLSLAVKDLATSRAFYEKLGFEMIGGEPEQNWIILGHDSVKIGLFQGMFEGNILTWNPEDVRSVQKQLKAHGFVFQHEADEDGSGPAHATLLDPDGNAILLDQHH